MADTHPIGENRFRFESGAPSTTATDWTRRRPIHVLLDTIQSNPTFSEAIHNALRELESGLSLTRKEKNGQ